MFIVVDLICGSCPSMAGLPHASRSISSYLGSIDRKWTLESESANGIIWRMNMLLKCEWPGLSDYFREKRFENAIEDAILSQNHEVLLWWLVHYTLPDCYGDPNVKVLQLAIEHESVDVLEWLKENNRLPTHMLAVQVPGNYPLIAYWLHDHSAELRLQMSLNMEVYDGDFEFVKWTHAHKSLYAITGMSCVVDYAISHHHLNELWWLQMHRSEKCSPDALEIALRRDADLATLLYENYPPGYFKDSFESIVSHSMEEVEWIVSHYEWQDLNKCDQWVKDCIQDAEMIYRARQERYRIGDEVRVINLLIEHEFNDGGEAMATAALYGDLDMVKWFHARHMQVTTAAMDSAASEGYLEVMEWLHKNRNEGCTTKAMDGAATNNRLHMVKWLHTNRSEGCTTEAMDKAALKGHLEMVQWLHTNRSEGCTTKAMDGAASRGYLKLVKWLHVNRSEGCTVDAMDGAIEWGCSRFGDDRDAFNIVRWLHRNRSEGCSPKAAEYAIHRPYFYILQWLHASQPGSFTSRAMDVAAANGHRKIVQWLHRHRTEGCTTDAMDAAAKNKDWGLARWLGINRTEGGTAVCVDSASKCGNFKMAIFLTIQCKIYCDVQTLDAISHRGQPDFLEWLLKHYHDVGYQIKGNPYVRA